MTLNNHRIGLRLQHQQSQIQPQQRRSLDNDYGITSLMDDSSSISSNSVFSINKLQQISSNSSSSSSSNSSSNNSSYHSSSTYDKNYVVPKVKSIAQQQHFRMIVCGDSGIGKSALVHALTNNYNSSRSRNNSSTNSSSFEPIEVFVPNTDICIIDTIGYGALLRAEVVFSHIVNYIEAQFEKTNSIFNNNRTTSTAATPEEEEEDKTNENEEERLKYIVYRSNDIFTNVDCCLYLIMGRLKPVDIEYMKSIHTLCNIVPVIIQPDLSLRPEIRMEQRLDILITMQTNEIQFNYLGYNTYEELISAIKQPMTHPYCPPFILDYSPSKQQQLFHGLVSLKQAIFQHRYQYLKYDTTEKFMSWRRNNRNRQQEQRQPMPSINTSRAVTAIVSPATVIHSTDTTTTTTTTATTAISSSSPPSSSSSSSSFLSTATIATTTTTSSMSQEQQLNKIKISHYLTKRRHILERELLTQEKKLQQEFESIWKEKKMEFILKELNHLMIGQQQEKQDDKKKKEIKPMIYANYWIFLSILLSIFICYQNRHLFFSV